MWTWFVAVTVILANLYVATRYRSALHRYRNWMVLLHTGTISGALLLVTDSVRSFAVGSALCIAAMVAIIVFTRRGVAG